MSAGDNRFGQCSTREWDKLIAIAAGENHTLGLRYDGTVVATGRNDKGQCNVGSWKQIEYIQANAYTSIGIQKDGSFKIAGTSY